MSPRPNTLLNEFSTTTAVEGKAVCPVLSAVVVPLGLVTAIQTRQDEISEAAKRIFHHKATNALHKRIKLRWELALTIRRVSFWLTCASCSCIMLSRFYLVVTQWIVKNINVWHLAKFAQFCLPARRFQVFLFCLQRSSNKCSARKMDEDVTRLSIHSDEPKIILHGSGNEPHSQYCFISVVPAHFSFENTSTCLITSS